MATPAITNDLDYRPSYLAATIAGLAVLLLYILTLSPETAMWDTSEYLTAAYTLGLPHPPGNPFFVIIGRVAAVLPIAPSVAMRINLLAAISSAVSAAMWFLITERVLVGWLAERWQRIAGGALAALIGATAFTVWAQSVVNEKVYTVSLVGIAIVAWLAVRWSDEPDGRSADRTLVLIAYICGLGYANHMAGMLAAPAVGLAVLLRKPSTLLRWRLVLACVGALVLGGTPFLSQPIRSAHWPAINEGEPTACRTELKLDCTLSKGTYDAFMYNFNRGQYGKPDLAERQAPFTAQVGMWWLYFKWQWIRDAHGERPGLQSALAATFLVLGFLGGWVHWKRDRRSFAFFGPLMFSLTLLLIYYLNFKYGYSQDPALGESVNREVRDRDYFYLWSFSAWSVWAALGLLYVWETVAALFGSTEVVVGKEVQQLPKTRSWLLASPLLAVAFVPLFANQGAASRRGQTDTADFAIDLLNSVEPYGILVTVGDNDTFPLWYAQEVLGVRKDVIVANTSLLNTDWYTRQMIRRPVFAYDEAKGPDAYRGKSWKKPSGPPFTLTMDESDQVPLSMEVTQPQLFQKGALQAVIQPRVLSRADLFVLRMIQDNPDRPVYFSRTSGSLMQELGLQEYGLTQGLARRLVEHKLVASGDTVPVPGEGFVDLARSRQLWKDMKAPTSLIKKNDWPDRASVGIPYLYVSTGVVIAEAANTKGDAKGAADALAVAKNVAKATKLDDLFTPGAFDPAPPPVAADSSAKTQVPVGPRKP
ncbi:MAG: DUF2723 domain-containing protein [Gemmatimonadaceae bacterium]|nr:DUF2723 domain-containing protein [Gemmatimonadaceae bacterium]